MGLLGWFDNIKIQKKLFLAFGVLVFLMFVIVLFSVSQITGINVQNDKLISAYVQRQNYLASALENLIQIRFANLYKLYLLEYGDSPVVADMDKGFEANWESFTKNLSHYRDSVNSDTDLSGPEKEERGFLKAAW